jgi:hypothetical protein
MPQMTAFFYSLSEISGLAVLLHKLWVSGEVYEPLHVRSASKTVAA